MLSSTCRWCSKYYSRPGFLVGAHADLLACVGGLAFLVRVCFRRLPVLVYDCLCVPNHHHTFVNTSLRPHYVAPTLNIFFTTRKVNQGKTPPAEKMGQDPKSTHPGT